jgi:hypothetical protein
VLRVWLIVMFAGAGGMFVGSLASTHVLGINQDASAIPAARDSKPVYASKQTREWLDQTIMRGRWVHPDAPGLRVEYVSVLPGKGRSAMSPGVAMAANAKRAPQNGRIQF